MIAGGHVATGVRVVDGPDYEPHTATNVSVATTLVPSDSASMDASVRTLNATDVAVIQHEYGIWGGDDGEQVLDLMSALTVPAIAVLHTVLDTPTPRQQFIVEEIMRMASATVVMTQAALDMIRTLYSADTSGISVIPHGVTPPHQQLSTPPIPSNGRPVILTWGLIGPGKGIEWGVRALSQLKDLDPRPIYRVVGQTHPKVRAHEGEAYRTSLTDLARLLAVDHDVEFHDAYMEPDVLARHVAAASVVLLPYDSTTQITSGVIVEAIAAGIPVVATGFPHAIELQPTGAVTVVNHHDSLDIANAVRSILTDPGLAARMSHRGQAWGTHASWPAVGSRFRALAQTVTASVAA